MDRHEYWEGTREVGLRILRAADLAESMLAEVWIAFVGTAAIITRLPMPGGMGLADDKQAQVNRNRCGIPGFQERQDS
jgi:hypothetical protein